MASLVALCLPAAASGTTKQRVLGTWNTEILRPSRTMCPRGQTHCPKDRSPGLAPPGLGGGAMVVAEFLLIAFILGIVTKTWLGFLGDLLRPVRVVSLHATLGGPVARAESLLPARVSPGCRDGWVRCRPAARRRGLCSCARRSSSGFPRHHVAAAIDRSRFVLGRRCSGVSDVA